MVEIESGFRENTVGAVEQFAEIASVDPISALMLLSGAVILAFSIGFFGIATVGAVLASLKRGLSGSEEPNRPA